MLLMSLFLPLPPLVAACYVGVGMNAPLPTLCMFGRRERKMKDRLGKLSGLIPCSSIRVGFVGGSKSNLPLWYDLPSLLPTTTQAPHPSL